MSQADRMPKIKKIELTAKQLRPPEGSKAVDTLPDGTVVYEGPIFAGNPYFQNHADPKSIDKGFTRIAVMDPSKPGEQKWKRNRNGEPIVPVFKNKRRTKIARFVMVDFGNGDAGPRPVPSISASERSYREMDAEMPEYQREFMRAAMEEGIAPRELAKKIASLAKPMAPKRGPGRPPKNPEPEAA